MKRIREIATLAPAGKLLADAHGCIDFDLILGLSSVVLFGSILLNHSKAMNS